MSSAVRCAAGRPFFYLQRKVRERCRSIRRAACGVHCGVAADAERHAATGWRASAYFCLSVGTGSEGLACRLWAVCERCVATWAVLISIDNGRISLRAVLLT
jgi:hypothetical protein